MTKYTEILKLKKMLEEAKIPFEFEDDLYEQKKANYPSKNYPAYKITLSPDVDVIQHKYSNGEEQNLLEIMGGMTVEEMKVDDIKGYLTAEEVFKRFKYCYEHNTSVYVEED